MDVRSALAGKEREMNCPKCGSPKDSSDVQDWLCGSWMERREFRQDSLCKSRQENNELRKRLECVEKALRMCRDVLNELEVLP